METIGTARFRHECSLVVPDALTRGLPHSDSSPKSRSPRQSYKGKAKLKETQAKGITEGKPKKPLQPSAESRKAKPLTLYAPIF